MKKRETHQELEKESKMLRARVAALERSERKRRRMRESLREAEQFSHEVISGAGEGIVAYDRELRYVVWNKFMENLTGVPAADVLGKQAEYLFPQLRQQGVDRLLERALAGATICSPDTPYYAPQTGKAGWVIGTYAPHRDSRGNVIGVIGLIHDITDRKQAEQALQKSEQYARCIIDSSLDMIITVDNQRRIVEFNKAAQETFGYTLEQVIGKHINLLYADPVEGQELHRATFEQGKRTQEVLNRRKNGEVFSSHVSTAIMRDSSGELIGVVGVSRDITETERAKEARRQAEEQYRTIFENAVEGIFQSTPEGRFISVNPALARMWGYASPQDLVAGVTNIAEQVYFDSTRRAEFQRLVEERGAVQGFEYQARRQDGSVMWVSENARAVRDDAGTLLYYEGTIEDITARKQAEEEILREKALFQQLFENAPIGIAMLDTADRIQNINLAFQSIFQYTPDEVAGRPINAVIVPNDLREEASQLSSQALGGQPVRRESVRLRKDGTRIPVEIYGVPVKQDGKSACLYAIYVDISEMKQMEGQLKREVEKLSALHEIDRALATLDLQACLRVIVQQARTLFATDLIAILLREGNQLRLVAEEGLMSHQKEIVISLPSGLCGWSCAHGKSVLVPDVLQDSRYLSFDPRTRSEMVAPLMVHDDCIGVLNVESARVNAFSPADLELLEGLAARAGMAIHNARLHAAEREQRQFAETIREIGLTLTSNLDPDAVFDQLLDQVGRVVPYDSAALLLLEENLVRCKRQRGFEKVGLTDWMRRFEIPLSELAGLVKIVETGQPHVVPDTSTDSNWTVIEETRFIRSWIGAPITIRGTLIGFLALDKFEPGFYTDRMAERLGVFAGQAGLALDNARLYVEQQKLAITDGLTGLFNRRYFVDLAQRELIRARRQRAPFAVLMLDLDNLKSVNDKFGHSVGDEALKHVAKTLASHVRTIDVVARYGGDEFVILMPDCRGQEAERVADRIQAQIKTRPLPVENGSIELSFSIGAAISTLTDEETLDSLLSHADAEMYRQKEQRRALPSSNA